MDKPLYRFEVNVDRKLVATGWATADFISRAIRSQVLDVFDVITDCKAGRLGPWPNINDIATEGEECAGYCGHSGYRVTWAVKPVAVRGEWNR